MSRDETLSAVLQQNRLLREELKEAREWAIRMRDERASLQERRDRLLVVAVHASTAIKMFAPNIATRDELDAILDRELDGMSKLEWERINRREERR